MKLSTDKTTHSLKNTLRELMAFRTKCEPRFGTVATFSSAEFFPGLERTAADCQVDLVRISSPEAVDFELFEVFSAESSYFSVASEVTWKFKLNQAEGNGSEVAGSENIKIRVANSSDWENLHELLNSQNSKSLLISQDSFEPACEHPLVLEFKDGPGGDLIAMFVLEESLAELSLVIRSAVYVCDETKLQICIESLAEYAKVHGFQFLKFNSEKGYVFGKSAIDILEQRVRLGFSPSFSDDSEIIKILNQDIVDGHILIFSERNYCDLSTHARTNFIVWSDDLGTLWEDKFGYQSKEISVVDLVDQIPERLSLVQNVARSVNPEAVVNQLLDLHKEAYPRNSLDPAIGFFSKDPYVQGEESVARSVFLTNDLLLGHGSFGFLMALAAQRNIVQNAPCQIDLVLNPIIQSADVYMRLGGYLLEHPMLHKLAKRFVSLCLQQVGVPNKVFENVISVSAKEAIASMLSNVAQHCGNETLTEVISLIGSVIDLDEFIVFFEDWEVVEVASPLGHVDLKSDFSGYWKDPQVDSKGEQLIRNCYSLWLRGGFACTLGQADPTLRWFSDTEGGEAAGVVFEILDHFAERGSYGGHFADYNFGLGELLYRNVCQLGELVELKSHPVSDSGVRDYLDIVGQCLWLPNHPAAMESWLVTCNVNPDELGLWGRQVRAVLLELLHRVSGPVMGILMIELSRMNSHKFSSAELNKSLQWLLGLQNKSCEYEILGTLNYNRDSYQKCSEILKRMVYDCEDIHSALRKFANALEVEPSRFGDTGFTVDLALTDILRRYFDKAEADVNFHEFFEELLGAALTLFLENREATLLLNWLVVGLIRRSDAEGNYKFDKSYFASLVLPALELVLPKADNYIDHEYVLMLSLCLAESSLSARAEGLFARIPPTIVYYREEDESHRETVEKSISSLDLSKEEKARICDVYARYAGRVLKENRQFIYYGLNLLMKICLLIGSSVEDFVQKTLEHTNINPDWMRVLVAQMVEIQGQYRVSRAFIFELHKEILSKGTSFSRYSDGFSEADKVWLSAFPWSRNDFDRPTTAMTEFMIYKADVKCHSEAELSDFIAWTLEFEFPVINELFLDLLRLLRYVPKEDANGFIERMAEHLAAKPFESIRYGLVCFELIELLDAKLGYGLAERLYGNSDFLAKHPWESYGFSEKFSMKMAGFTENQKFSGRRACSLVQFAFSCNGKDINRYWVSALVLSATGSESDHLVKLMNFWLSLTAEAQDSFILNRMSGLLQARLLKVSREVHGKSFDNVRNKVKQASPKGTQINPGLLDRFHEMCGLRDLFARRAGASNGREREKAERDLFESLLNKRPLQLEALAEERVLVAHQTEQFESRLREAGTDIDSVKSFLDSNMPLLQSTGIFDTLVQCSSFVDEVGLERLKLMLEAYADVNSSRVIKVERPDLGGIETEHFDYFGKFADLASMLVEKGVSERRMYEFMYKWMKLWYFIPVVSKTDAEQEQYSQSCYLTVTHDLERWTKHAEEPVRTCNRMHARGGNQPSENWNYQFGPNASVDGRPISRILLPQLKLAEFREDGKPTARCVIEVTVDDRDDQDPEIALLVEKVYKSRDSLCGKTFLPAIVKDFAADLGVPQEKVFFSADADKGYPAPLPEEYRIYRDTFRV